MKPSSAARGIPFSQAAYLFQVKTKEESSGRWDLYKLVATTPAEQAVRPPSEGGCKFVQKT